MLKANRAKIVKNYYIASNALMKISTMDDIPDELKRLALEASNSTNKVIDYVNSNIVKQNKNLGGPKGERGIRGLDLYNGKSIDLEVEIKCIDKELHNLYLKESNKNLGGIINGKE